jgi:hypothetical protein
MDVTNTSRVELTRSGRRSGCSCCGLTSLGILAIPVAAVLAVIANRKKK